MAKLTFILDDGETIEVPLHDHVTIGRADGNDVVVYDPRISSRHAELHFLTDGGFEVRDLASKAGTFVNGERVERKILGHGDTVSFGPLKGAYTVEANEPNGARRPAPTPEQTKHSFQPGVAKSIIKHPTAPENPAGGGGRLLSPMPSVQESKPKVEIVPDAVRPAASAGGGARTLRTAADALSPGPAFTVKQEPSKLLAAVLAIPGETGKTTNEGNSKPAVPPSSPSEAAGRTQAGPIKQEASRPQPMITSSLARPVPPQARTEAPPIKEEPPKSPEPLARAAPAERPAATAAPVPASKTAAPSSANDAGKTMSWPGTPRPTPQESPTRDTRQPPAARSVAPTQADMRTAADSKLAAEARTHAEARPLTETKLTSEPRPAAESRPSVETRQAAELRMPAARTLPQVQPQPQLPSPTSQRASTFQSQLPPASPVGTDAATLSGRSKSAEPPAEQPGTHAAAPPAPSPSMPTSDFKSSTPSVIEAAPGLDQRVVSLVYSKLQGDAKAAITGLEQRQKALDDEVSRMNYQLMGMQEERKKLLQGQSDLEQKHQAEIERLENLRQEHANAEKKFLQFTTSIKEAQGRLADLQAQERQLAHVTDELGQAERKREELHHSIEALVAEGERKQAAVQASIDALLAEGEKKRSETHHSIESLITEAESKRHEVRASVESLMAEREAKQGEVQAAIDALIAEGEIKRAEVQAAIDALGMEGDAKHAEILASIEALNADGEARRAEWYAEISRIAAEGEAHRADWQNEYEKLDAEAEAHQTEINAAIQALKLEEEQAREAVQRQNDELQRLIDAGQDALREFEAMTSNKEQMGVQLLNLLKEQELHDARLADLRRQIGDAEARVKSVNELAEAREDQVRTLERKLTSLDQQRASLEHHIKELTESENRLVMLLPQLAAGESRQAELVDAVESLISRERESQATNASLEARTRELQVNLAEFEAVSAQTRANLQMDIAAIQQSHLAETEILEAFVAESDATRELLQSQQAAAEDELAARQKDVRDETARLEDTIAKREEIERQCLELADTEKKLADSRAGLLKSESQRKELDIWIKELEGRRAMSQRNLDGLNQEEESSRGRLEVLRGKEADLRNELEQLAQKELADRSRFEELRRLTVEAESEHSTHMDALRRAADVARRELADVEVKLGPLREWKESMDKRYSRLASLPEDSTEARELWKEIEAQKAGLTTLISTGGMIGGNAGTGESAGDEEAHGDESTESGDRSKPKRSLLQAITGKGSGETPEERGNVGQTGTGAMLSGTGQEMALKARLNRLRESVQREATRLEFLRQERSREENRKYGSGTGEAMLKEQERQLENKVRRDEEKLATLERKIEMAEMEEEKRRERLADFERKLTEIKSDITDHERARSEALRKSELAQAEFKVVEGSAGRVRSSGESDSGQSRGAGSGDARPKLKTMGVPVAPGAAQTSNTDPDGEKGMGELLLGQRPEE